MLPSSNTWSRYRNLAVLTFLILHLSIACLQGFWTTIDKYYEVHYQQKFDAPYVQWARPSSHLYPYYILSGIDTGYGFYGIHTGTEKYFAVTYFNAAGQQIKKDRLYGLSTTNGFSRLKGYAANLSNYVMDTKELQEGKQAASPQLINLRHKYIEKSFKWIGKQEAARIKECHSYKVEIVAIVPLQSVRNRKDASTKPFIYSVKSHTFRV
jgi:hypothetical protein